MLFFDFLFGYTSEFIEVVLCNKQTKIQDVMFFYC